VSISTMDQLIAGLLAPVSVLKTSATGEAAGELWSPFYTAGYPGAATAPSPGVNGAALTSYTGSVEFPSAVSGSNVYLAGVDACQGGSVGEIWVCDRLWHNSGLTVTTTGAQAITTPTFPSRDSSGGATGAGLMLGIEVSTATTNGSAITNMTASYTDDAGNTGNTATMTSFPATAVAGHFSVFNLAAGDRGLRALASVTFGTSLGAGAVHLVVFRVLARIPTPTANISNRLDALQLGMPRMYDNSVPFLLYRLTGTAVGTVSATLSYAQG
jgi:hypothetical protein